MKLKNISVNRITAVFIALFIAMFLMNFSFDTNASNTSIKYSIYNAKTGSYIDEYTLNALEIDNNANTVSTYASTDDGRFIDWSKSGVVKIMTQIGFRGTGFVVDSHTIATAAHVVFDSAQYHTIPITSIYLFDKNGNKTLEATPVECHVPSLYWCRDNLDYALITVKEDLSSYCCFDLGVVCDSIVNKNQNVKISGFPKYHNENIVNTDTVHNMYSGTAVITRVTDGGTNRVYYQNVNTYGGDSGSPVYIENNYYGEKYNTVVAIHTSSEGTNKYGTCITTDILHFYHNNRNMNW